MTAAPHSPMVERISNRFKEFLQQYLATPHWYAVPHRMQQHCDEAAQAALAACEAEALRNMLRRLLSHCSCSNDREVKTLVYRSPADQLRAAVQLIEERDAAIRDARALLARLEAKP